MPASTVHCTVKLRSDTAANWTSADPVLGQGEMGIEYDTFKFKIGNGTDCWNDITNPYLVNTGDIEIADKITHIGDTDTAIRFPANDTFTIETAGTEAFRVDSNQKILIGGPTASYANASSGNFQVGVHTSATATGITIGGTSTNSISFADDGDDQAGLIKYTHSDNSLSFHTDGATNQRMTIDSSGNIFIGGTTAATADIALNASGSASFASAVEVTSGLRMFRTAGDSSKRVNIGESDTLAVWQNDGNFIIKYDGSATFKGQVKCQDGSGNAQLVIGTLNSAIYATDSIFIQPGGTTTATFSTGSTTFAGAVSKGSGSFKISHPLPAKTETHHLVHSFIEGPQADLIYRGYVDLVDGQATVNIDTAGRMTEGTFEVLCANVSCFTSNESDWTAVKGSVTGNVLTITAQDATATSKVSWMVVGERQDQHMLETDWTDDAGRVITEPEKVIKMAEESEN